MLKITNGNVKPADTASWSGNLAPVHTTPVLYRSLLSQRKVVSCTFHRLANAVVLYGTPLIGCACAERLQLVLRLCPQLVRFLADVHADNDIAQLFKFFTLPSNKEVDKCFSMCVVPISLPDSL
eukprot:scpid102085/ scgid14142/ 